MLCWRSTIHNTLSYIYVVLEVLGIADRWQCEIYMFQIYVLLEVLDVVLEVYHTQHTFIYMLC